MYSKMKYRLNMLRMLISFSGNLNVIFYGLFILKALIMLLEFAVPLLYSKFIDGVIVGGNFVLMPYIVLGYTAIYLINSLLTYIVAYGENKLVNAVTLGAKKSILEGYFNRCFTEYDKMDSGYMKTRMEDDTQCIEKYLTIQSADYVISLATFIIAAALLVFIEWRLAAFAIISIPVTIAVDYAIAKREAIVLTTHRQNNQNMASWLHSSIQGWREIKTLNLQKHEDRTFMKFIHTYAITFGIWINYWVFRHLVVPRIKEEFLMKFALYFSGGLMVISGRLEIAALLVFMQYYALFAKNIQKVSETDAELISTTPQSDRLLEEMEGAANKNKPFTENFPGYGIRLENVSFAYNADTGNILNNVSMSIDEGERIAIKGKSGAGKTTLLKLITGMLSPSSGRILIGNRDLADISLKNLHRKIGFVMQDSLLLNDTIKDNLLYGNPSASMKEIENACEKAHILFFIEELPDKFETVIGERGIKLSGGQKQRLILARQFLRNVDIYIFDEATSALDQNSENIIQESISYIGKDKTIIVVAHRDSSTVICDKMIYIDN